MFALTDTRKLSIEGAWVHITDASTGKPAYAKDKDGNPDKKRPVRIRVAGADSPEVQKRAARRAAKLVKQHGGSVDLETMSEDEIFDLIDGAPKNKIEDSVAATIDWENMPGSDGKDVPFSEDNARALFEFSPTALRDVEELVGDPAAFTKAALKG